MEVIMRCDCALKRRSVHALCFSVLPALLCVLLQGFFSYAAALEHSVSAGSQPAVYPLHQEVLESYDVSVALPAQEAAGQGAMKQVGAEEGSDTADDLLRVADAGNASPAVQTTMTSNRNRAFAIQGAALPPAPPPEKIALTENYQTLIAAAPAPAPQDPPQSEPAPEPKTSKSSSVSTPVLVAATAAVAVGVAVAAGGGGSSSDSGTSNDSGTQPDPATPSSGSSEVINLSSLVRIGDDNDYNAHHPDKFKVSHPSGTSWTDSFTINNYTTIRSAKFRYTVAASKVANPVFINGRQAGRLCNPGNTAWNVESCSIDITGYIHGGSNEIKIKTAIDSSDTETPLDDVELYDLRIELTR